MARPPRTRRVLMVSEGYPPKPGGTERQLERLARQLAGTSVHVEIVTPRLFAGTPADEVVDGVRVRRLSFLRIRFLATPTLLLHALLFLLVNVRRFDVLHVHTVSYLALVTVLVGHACRRPIVLKAAGWWELEGVLNHARRRELVTRVSLAILRRASAWIAVSRELKQAMLAAGIPAARVHLLPNGVDTTRFAPAGREASRRHLGLAPDGVRVVFVGRLVPEKELATLLEAWKVVTDKVEGAWLDLVGSGPLAGELAKQSRRLGIADTVVFHGERPGVERYLQAADCFVLPSSVEGMSNALLEAMATGLPVVATRIGGTEQLVTDGVNGWLVSPGDADELARAICAVLGDATRARQNGARGRRRVESRYGIERIAARYVAMYDALSGAAGRRRGRAP